MEAQLRAARTRTGRPLNQLRRQYVTQRFLARVYAQHNPEWVLVGGTALLARIPAARHSKDVDFVHPADLSSAVEDLSQLASLRPAPDLFVFDVTLGSKPVSDNKINVRITARLGVAVYDMFTVDITRRDVVGAVEAVHADPVIEVDDVGPLPPFAAVPIQQQIADKLCAMYEIHWHGSQSVPSSRYRDLVDLVIISFDERTPIVADAVASALAEEQRRRGMTVPVDLPVPAPTWAAGYRSIAVEYLATSLHGIDAAMGRLRGFAGPVLAGTAAGLWALDGWRES